MKRAILIFFLCLVFILGYSFYFHGGAVDDNSGVESVSSKELEDDSFLDSSNYPALRSPVFPDDLVSSSGSDWVLTGVSIQSVAPIEPDDDGSLKSLILSLIGSYDPIVLEYSYQSSQGYTSYLREVQLDYPWLASALLFIVILYCIMRIGGRVIWKT